MIEGVIGAQLLNLSAAIALRIVCAENESHTESTRVLDFVLMLGGALACFPGMVWFRDHLGGFALFLWPLSFAGFVAGVWPVEERARYLLGLVSLVAGAALLLVWDIEGVFLHPDRFPPGAPSFCPGCIR
jgi:hypothetical protein